MRYLLIVFLAIILTTCVSSKDLVSPGMDRLVPSGADHISMMTKLQPGELYDAFQRELLKAGYRISDTNEEMFSISTEGTAVGQSTQARFLFYIEPDDFGSTITGRAEWIPGSTANAMASAMAGIATDTQWEQASWTSGRPKRAMAAMINVMNKIKNSGYDFSGN